MRPRVSGRAALLAAAAGLVFSGGCGPGSTGTEGGKPAAHQSKNIRQMEDFMKTKKSGTP